MTSPAVSLRFADPDSAASYPANVAGELAWQRHSALWQTTVSLPDLEPGGILAPSLAVLNNWPYEFRFELIADQGRWPLPKVPNEAGVSAPAGSSDAVHGKLDCWHVNQTLTGVEVQVSCAAASLPTRYLLTLNSRSLRLADLPEPPMHSYRVPRPAQFSQMLENPRIASRTCSPVSLAMALDEHCGSRAALHQILPLCHDPATGMYGMWPLAIRTASRYGVIGALELLSDWSLVIASLEAGHCIVASIRYAPGTLSGSPQPGSGGHLVVVYGVDGNTVLVNDPAAPNRGVVSRCYPIEQFSEAWFRHRGAAYILAS
jgi:hypothetical protein